MCGHIPQVLRRQQWLALVLLSLGVGLVQYQEAAVGGAAAAAAGLGGSAWLIGVAAVLASSLLSGFANVYFEKVVKQKTEVTIWVRNVQLGLFSLPQAASLVAADSMVIAQHGALVGFTPLAWSVVILKALGVRSPELDPASPSRPLPPPSLHPPTRAACALAVAPPHPAPPCVLLAVRRTTPRRTLSRSPARRSSTCDGYAGAARRCGGQVRGQRTQDVRHRDRDYAHVRAHVHQYPRHADCGLRAGHGHGHRLHLPLQLRLATTRHAAAGRS